jgi:hypothetical protein
MVDGLHFTASTGHMEMKRLPNTFFPDYTAALWFHCPEWPGFLRNGITWDVCVRRPIPHFLPECGYLRPRDDWILLSMIMPRVWDTLLLKGEGSVWTFVRFIVWSSRLFKVVCSSQITCPKYSRVFALFLRGFASAVLHKLSDSLFGLISKSVCSESLALMITRDSFIVWTSFIRPETDLKTKN